MDRYGAIVVDEPSELEVEKDVKSQWMQLFRPPLLSQTLAICTGGFPTGTDGSVAMCQRCTSRISRGG